jgi:hypothetical protein
MRAPSDGRFEVLCETPATLEPCESALHDATSAENYEAVCGVGAFNEFQGAVAFALQGVFEFVGCISASAKTWRS